MQCPIAILTKATAGTGNFVTAERISECVSGASGRRCLIVEESQFDTDAQFSRWVEENQACFVLGVHAFRAGRLLCNGSVPYGILLGGTDVNVDMQTPSAKRDVCMRAILRARFVVAFSEEMVGCIKPTMSSLLPSPAHLESVLRKVRVIHQSVSVPREIIRGETGLPSIHQYLGINIDVNVILLPAALRPIKAPLYLLHALQSHRATNAAAFQFCLVIVGPSLDDDTLRSVQAACEMQPQVCRYVGLQHRHMVLRWMTCSLCVVNTSESEGMSGTILEAMAIGCPVVARNNSGNCSIVTHGVNGFIFSTAAEAVLLCSQLVAQGASLRAQICKAAADSIARSHSRESESLEFQSLLREHGVL
jgi:glycosyltransferase involved in cell wall biosynthesis